MIEIISTEKAEEDWYTGHLYVNGATDEAEYYFENGQWKCDNPHKGIPEGLADEPCTAFPEKTEAWIEQEFPMAHGSMNNLQMLRNESEFTFLADYSITSENSGDVTDEVLNPLRLLKLAHSVALQKGLKIMNTSWNLYDDGPVFFTMSYAVAAAGSIGQRLDELVEKLRLIEQEAMETLRQEARKLLK